MRRDPKFDQRVDAYIAKAQPFARPVLEEVRRRVHSVIPEVEEALKWSSPAFLLNGKILIVMAAFKAHAALNFWRGKDIAAEPKAGAMGQFGKLTSIDDLPSEEEFEKLLRSASNLASSAPLTPRVKSAPKPLPAAHPEFARALKASPAASDTYEASPPGQKREYLDWINDAKRDETRSKRITQAVEWLAEGKRRNWKYENC